MANSIDYATLASQLKRVLKPLLDPVERVITDPAICHAMGTDASFYRLTPQIIVKVTSVDELILVIQQCVSMRAPFTFRAAGTSLSGQAISDSVLIMLTDDWANHEILAHGHKIRLQPGVIGAEANRLLQPYGRKLGPDPASINSCKIGGIAANNASGMCCGVANNSYQTLHSMRLVLADGGQLDTADALSIAQFRKTHGDLLNTLSQLADQIKADRALSQFIGHKYRLKNTTGYGINALLDFTDPIDILQHLIIGSEGTLGFIAEITYRTVVDHPFKASALFIFADVDAACRAVAALKTSQFTPDATELMDGRALESIADHSQAPPFLANCNIEQCGLLIECHAESSLLLERKTKDCHQVIEQFAPVFQLAFSNDKSLCFNLWQLRKGLFPAIGAHRAKGTSVIIEDIAFPVEQLAEATRDLKQLFEIYGYHQAIIFGHALEGNLHFVFTQDFNQPSEIRRYQLFMAQVTELVGVKYQGSLKAEHGTGRNMAPFVKLEWGEKAFALMSQIKQLFDPLNLLNPGVIINPDDACHINHLKTQPAVDDIIDRCTECGFCEAVCPSRGLTLTPRQRIVMFRQLADLTKSAQLTHQRPTAALKKQIKQLNAKLAYWGIDTCAATGLCAERCPIEINTGEMVLKHRAAMNKKISGMANWSANHFKLTTQLAKTSIKASSLLKYLLPTKTAESLSKGIHRFSHQTIPIWFNEYPTANKSTIKPSRKSKQKVVYYSGCAARTMGTQSAATDQRSLQDVTISLLEKAGFEVIVPNEQAQSCCGLPLQSKGLFDIADKQVQQLGTLLIDATHHGQYPILIDTSPCVKRSRDKLGVIVDDKTGNKLAIFEAAEFILKFCISQLTLSPVNETVMLHVTCSSQRMGLSNTLTQLAKLCAQEVYIPRDIYCCGFAGDKGFTTPALNASALASLRSQRPSNCHRGFSNSLTCEIGLSRHSGVPYQSLLYLVDEVSSAKDESAIATKK